MPRRHSLTGRVERRIDRQRHINVNDSVILVDNFKCALNPLPKDFVSYDCGPMNLRCIHCDAMHFESEITMRDRQSFTLCCHKGKAILPALQHNVFFQNLYEGLRSTDQQIKSRSKNYFGNIRSFNSAFAMISSEAEFDETVMRGVYHFKIHNVFYHRAGPLTNSGFNRSQPRYAQLYFYDTTTANNFRLRQLSNESCNEDLMRYISIEIQRVNPFVQSFISMHEYCEQPEHAHKEMCLLITVNRDMPRTEMGRFNDAITTDVAVIFSTVDGEPPFERNMVAFHKTTGTLKNVSVLDSSLDPLAYPLLFPNGDTGWHNQIFHNVSSTSNSNRPRNKITMLQYASSRLAIRNNFSLLHHSQKLFLQWIVDMYVRIEGTRLNYLRINQDNLRSDVLNNITDYLSTNANGDGNEHIGRKIILPSSFTGSPRNMYQNYLDAMSIVQHFGKPSLFVTMTCNPKWPEITSNIDFNEATHYRPEIIVRVFRAKLRELIDAIVTKKIFGTVAAIIYTIEFQKRGLPHAHILISLHESDKIETAYDIDRVVCTEIPDIQTQPKLHEYVVKHMMHGPCGSLNMSAVCMKDGKCSKEFPKSFCESTHTSVNGYPMYKRRDNGISVEKSNCSLDNRYVVPYNPYLLAKFNCHINVEVCTTVKSVKYIYKYIYKGYDSATIRLTSEEGNVIEIVQVDEITNFLNGRYVGSTEAAWRIFEYPMHFQSHVIIRLDIHLPKRQNVIFREGQLNEAVENLKRTKLLAFFKLNIDDSLANQYKYSEIPLHFTWKDAIKTWKRRLRGADKVISRIYAVSPKNIELFHLRLLLLHVNGPKSFEDLRTYNDVVYNSFLEACHARGIASNDNEWRECLEEARQFNSPKQMRNLFAFICALNIPANALALWNEFKEYLSEDYTREHNQDIAFNITLLEIEDILLSHNVTCEALGLPIPQEMTNLINFNAFNPDDELRLFNDCYRQANVEQQSLIDRVIREVQYHDTGSNVFCVTAHAGCGKTFTQTAIIHRLNSLNLCCIATAFSGIASTLLIGGRTLHNVFKLPIPIVENSVPNITPNSPRGRYINSAALIIIDEISMCPLLLLKAIDRLLRDLCMDEQNKCKLFAGKTILLCGDFRQILPVVPHGSRSVLIENCIVSWDKFESFHHETLTQNMRALPHELEFVEFLKQIGNGEKTQYPQFGENVIELPQQLIGNVQNIIEDVFGNIEESLLSDQIVNSVVLAPTNDDCLKINRDVMNRMPGEFKAYTSSDKIICDDEREVNNYPIEFLNSLNVSGLPPHKLLLKVNCIVLLIRNLNTKDALVNGTRMRIKFLHNNAIDCEVITGSSRGKRILIPRVNLTYSGSILPFDFQRTQFPIIPAFAMTINKSQGQTFGKVGVLLTRPVFTHGQLYVAASRVRSFQSLKFYVNERGEQGRLAGDDRIFTKNIVFTEILRR